MGAGKPDWSKTSQVPPGSDTVEQLKAKLKIALMLLTPEQREAYKERTTKQE